MELKKSVNSTRPYDGVFRQNIVLMSGLLTGPVIAGATDLESAVVISLAFSVITPVTVSLCRFIPGKILYAVRIIFYVLIACLVYIPAYILAEKLMGSAAVLHAGIYLPVLVTNPLILSKTETRFLHRSFGQMLPELFGYIAGFDIVCLLIGILRDILVSSRIGWITVDTFGISVPALETSFGGFIMVGTAAGLCRAVYNKLKAKKQQL